MTEKPWNQGNESKLLPGGVTVVNCVSHVLRKWNSPHHLAALLAPAAPQLPTKQHNSWGILNIQEDDRVCVSPSLFCATAHLFTQLSTRTHGARFTPVSLGEKHKRRLGGCHPKISSSQLAWIQPITHFMSFVSRETWQAVEAPVPLKRKSGQMRTRMWGKQWEQLLSEQHGSNFHAFFFLVPWLQPLLFRRVLHLHRLDP